MKGLPTDSELEFRIIPVNGAGEGDPSAPTDMVKVRDPPSKFLILEYDVIL